MYQPTDKFVAGIKSKKKKNKNSAVEENAAYRVHADQNGFDGDDCVGMNSENGALESGENLMRLIGRIQSQIPENDTLHYKSRLNKLDWNKIKFDNYNAEECRSEWEKLSSAIRKFRTLQEIVEDAKVSALTYAERKNTPAKPLSTYMLYYMDTKSKIQQKYPGISGKDIAKHVGKRFKKLSPGKLEIYKERAKNLRDKYDAEMRVFLENYPHQKLRKQNDKPKSAFQLFRNTYLERRQNNPDCDKVKLQLKCKKRWDKMDPAKKLLWIHSAQENEEQYKKEHPSFVGPQMKTALTKDELFFLDKCAGKPDKPPGSAYSLFSREMLRSKVIKQIPSQGRMAEISRKWKTLSTAEKQTYADEVKRLQNDYGIEYKRYMDSLPDDKREEEEANLKRKKKKTATKDKDVNAKAANNKPETKSSKKAILNSLPESKEEEIESKELNIDNRYMHSENMHVMSISKKHIKLPDKNSKKILNSETVQTQDLVDDYAPENTHLVGGVDRKHKKRKNTDNLQSQEEIPVQQLPDGENTEFTQITKRKKRRKNTDNLQSQEEIPVQQLPDGENTEFTQITKRKKRRKNTDNLQSQEEIPVQQLPDGENTEFTQITKRKKRRKNTDNLQSQEEIPVQQLPDGENTEFTQITKRKKRRKNTDNLQSQEEIPVQQLPDGENTEFTQITKRKKRSSSQ